MSLKIERNERNEEKKRMKEGRKERTNERKKEGREERRKIMTVLQKIKQNYYMIKKFYFWLYTQNN